MFPVSLFLPGAGWREAAPTEWRVELFVWNVNHVEALSSSGSLHKPIFCNYCGLREWTRYIYLMTLPLYTCDFQSTNNGCLGYDTCKSPHFLVLLLSWRSLIPIRRQLMCLSGWIWNSTVFSKVINSLNFLESWYLSKGKLDFTTERVKCWQHAPSPTYLNSITFFFN